MSTQSTSSTPFAVWLLVTAGGLVLLYTVIVAILRRRRMAPVVGGPESAVGRASVTDITFE